MAVQPTPQFSEGYAQATDDALGLFGPTNKAGGFNENSNPQPVDEYESSLDERKIIELVSQWKRTYSVYYTDIEKKQKLSMDYWVGKHRTDDHQEVSRDDQRDIDNLIFEAVETFLPIATRANPEPLVTADPSELGQKLAKDIQVALVNWADTNKYRRKLAKVTRKWSLDLLGCLKFYWDVKTKEIKCEVISTKKMIFDKDGYIDEGGRYIGEYLGEKKRLTAEKLIKMFPKKREYLLRKCQGKLGTKLEYIEWWYRALDVFYTQDDEVLGKYKNPNWNYDGEVSQDDPETGEPVTSFIQGTNHLKEPSYPYLFLSVFSIGNQPHDDTSLITQNIPVQDRINRRYRQIGKNVDASNNGMVVSGRAFTEDQAAQAASALRRGVAIRVPDGNVNDAVARFPAPNLPSDVFTDLETTKNELRNIFGTSGSTPEGTEQQKSVRGKILINQLDSSRIGGGVTECIEQLADSGYNMVVQFMYVYYDEEHFIATAGETSGTELIALKNSDFPSLKTLTITVKEGSLVPKDPLTQRNEAIDLWSAGAIDPLTFYKRLDFPDPVKATEQLILWQMVQKGQLPPQAYLPTFQAGQMQPGASLGQPEGVGGPAVSQVNGPNIGEQGPPGGSPGAVQSESQQLLGAVPIH